MEDCLSQTLVCSGCNTTHDRPHFSSLERRKTPHQRLCTGYEGKVWICLHRVWSFAQIQAFLRSSRRLNYHPFISPIHITRLSMFESRILRLGFGCCNRLSSPYTAQAISNDHRCNAKGTESAPHFLLSSPTFQRFRDSQPPPYWLSYDEKLDWHVSLG